MKIIIFKEGYYCGGVDTFVINLINNWPDPADELIFICNKSHAGLYSIRMRLRRNVRLVEHGVVPFQHFFNKTKSLTVADRMAKLAFKASSPVTRYAFLIYNVFAIGRILTHYDADRLMVINGGYPGGDSCRAAAIAWHLSDGKRKSIHNFHGIVGKAPWHTKIQEGLVDRLLVLSTKRFVTVSRAAAEKMSARQALIKNSLAHYIYNGTDMPPGKEAALPKDIRSEIGVCADSPLCVMIGNYNLNRNYDKGHEFLFRVFSKVLSEVPSAHLLLCGYGSADDIERVRRLALKYGIGDNVHAFGFRDDLDVILSGSDILLIPAQAFESFGFAAIEAMAHSVPVVATDVGALPEIIVNGKGGYCIDRNDVDSFSGHVTMLLRDDKLRAEQGRKGYLRCERLFSAERMSREYADLIHEE